MALKLASKLDDILELPDIKGNPALQLRIKELVKDALPKTYKGTALIQSDNHFIYKKASDKPKPLDHNGNPLKKPQNHALVCFSNQFQFKDENKRRKNNDLPPMTTNEKKDLLKQLLKDPSFKQMYKDTYIAQYNQLREQYKEAQMLNPLAKNTAYIFDDKTLEYKRSTPSNNNLSLSDNEDDQECNLQHSDDE